MHEPAGLGTCVVCDRLAQLFHVASRRSLVCRRCLQPELPFPDDEKTEE
jgi:hypothetical protein